MRYVAKNWSPTETENLPSIACRVSPHQLFPYYVMESLPEIEFLRRLRYRNGKRRNTSRNNFATPRRVIYLILFYFFQPFDWFSSPRLFFLYCILFLKWLFLYSPTMRHNCSMAQGTRLSKCFLSKDADAMLNYRFNGRSSNSLRYSSLEADD